MMYRDYERISEEDRDGLQAAMGSSHEIVQRFDVMRLAFHPLRKRACVR